MSSTIRPTYYLQRHKLGHVIDRLFDRTVTHISTGLRTPAEPGGPVDSAYIRLDASTTGHSAQVLFEVITELDAFPVKGERWPGDVGGAL